MKQTNKQQKPNKQHTTTTTNQPSNQPEIRKITNQPTKQRNYRPTKSTNRYITKQENNLPSVSSVPVSPPPPPLAFLSLRPFRPSVYPAIVFLSDNFEKRFFLYSLGSHCLFATCTVDKCHSFRRNLKETYRKNWSQGNIP